MASTAPILLLLGSGPRIGASVTKAFTAKGYRVVTSSRKTADDSDTGIALHIPGDFSNPESIPSIFAKVQSTLGQPPSIVVYNAAAHPPSSATDPLSLSVKDLAQSLNINVLSAYSAAQNAVRGFAELPASASKTFIYTGNILNTAPRPVFLGLGAGKTASAHWIEIAADAYRDKGYKFYYADERQSDGKSAGQDVSGDAHAEIFAELAGDATQRSWLQTFVKGEGYKKF